MAGFWTHRFTVVLRPLRELTGTETTITLEARTASQARREATARHPDMKVLRVARSVEAVPVLTPRTTARSDVYPAVDTDETPRAAPDARARRA